MPLNADRRYLDAPELDMLLANTVDGSGLVVIGGRVVKIPPEGAIHDLATQVARFLTTQASRQEDGEGDAVAVRCSLLASIIGTLADLHAEPDILPFLDPAP
jgi:hypothetical protein